MSAFRRVGREYMAQIAAFAVALSDRLIIPAVFLRALGVPSFSAWSVAIACGGFVSVLEFGVTRYFSNRLIHLVEQHDIAAARRTFREAVTLIVALVAVALIVIAVGFRFFVKGVGDATADRDLWLVATPVTLAAAMVQLISIRQALYRAHRDFALETWIRCIGEAARILTVAAGAWLGANLVAVAWLWLGATLLFVFAPFIAHTKSRYPDFVGIPALPAAIDRSPLFSAAPGLWLQSMFMTLYAALPVFAIGAMSASAAVIAQFVLMRTIANFVRQILQMFSNVFGIELARRYARDDGAGFAQVFRETNRFLAVQTAVGAAVLVVLARPLFALWTGEIQLFDHTMLICAILPPLLIPSTMLSIEALAYANRPWPLVRARLLQATLTVIIFVVVPLEQIGLRMMIALAIGEIAGLGVPLAVEIRRLNPRLGLSQVLILIAQGFVTFGVTYAMVYATWTFVPLIEPLRLGLALGAGLLALLVTLAVIGVSNERRREVIVMARTRLFG